MNDEHAAKRTYQGFILCTFCFGVSSLADLVIGDTIDGIFTLLVMSIMGGTTLMWRRTWLNYQDINKMMRDAHESL